MSIELIMLVTTRTLIWFRVREQLVSKEALIAQFPICYVTISEQWCGRRLHGANVGYCTEVELLFYAIWGSLSKTGRRRQREEPGKDRFLFLTSLQLCLFLSWLKFLPFLPKFFCFVVSNYERATVVIFQNDVRVLSTKVQHLKSHVRHDGPEIMSISHIHVLLLSSAISLIVSRRYRRGLSSWCLSSLKSIQVGQQESSLDTVNRKVVDTDSQEETICFLGWQISAPVWIPPTANLVPEEEKIC